MSIHNKDKKNNFKNVFNVQIDFKSNIFYTIIF